MTHCVLTFTKRAVGIELASFRQDALQRARERSAPTGCMRRAHSQTLPKGYRNAEPVYDAFDEYAFDDFGSAKAWRQSAATQSDRAGEQVDSLLTRVITLVDGPVSAHGLKHVEPLHRRKDMDRQDFLAYWREVHGPLAAAIPTVRRYNQFPATDEEYVHSQPLLDGLAILWFDSTDSMRDGAKHPAFRMTREDMPHFMDQERSTFLLMQEVWSSGQP